MAKRIVHAVLVVMSCAFVVSCSANKTRFFPSSQSGEAAHLVGPAAWHAGNERSCLASGRVRETPYIFSRASIGRPTGCGAERPFVVKAALGGHVGIRPAATLRCNMIGPIDRWLRDVVQPVAQRRFGQNVVELKVIASYACRSRNSRRGAKLSEHGRANAIDISAFVLSDGSRVTVKQGWSWNNRGARFLRTVHRGACRHFTTVLGPNADKFHHDHFHFDLARHGRAGTYRVCR